MGKSEWNIPLILRRMIESLLVLGAILILAFPFVWIFGPDIVKTLFASHSKAQWVTFVFLELSGIICWFILLCLQKLLKTVIKTSPFVYCNVKYLKYTSYLCAFAALVLLIKTFVDFSAMTPIVVLLALLSSLFCQTLAVVFDKAIRLKDENDLTI